MRKFKATARDSDGKKYAGVFEAADEADAQSKLKAQGYHVLSLEEYTEEAEDSELHEQLKRKTIAEPEKVKPSLQKKPSANFVSGKKRSTGLLKPLLISAVCLLSIPLLILLFSPGEPEIPAKDVVKSYFNYEIKDNYKGQWDYLSADLRISYKDLNAYVAGRMKEVKNRRKEYSSDETEDSDRKKEKQTLTRGDVVGVKEEKHKAEFMTYIAGGSWQEHFLVNLKTEGNEWRITSVELVNVVDLSRGVPKVKSAVPSETEALDALSAQLKDAESQASGGVEGMKQRALNMLETAYKQGKLEESEYLLKKKNLEEL